MRKKESALFRRESPSESESAPIQTFEQSESSPEPENSAIKPFKQTNLVRSNSESILNYTKVNQVQTSKIIKTNSAAELTSTTYIDAAYTQSNTQFNRYKSKAKSTQNLVSKNHGQLYKYSGINCKRRNSF